MALPSSGAISLGDIQGEFEGSNPINISEYYRGGSYVPDTVDNSSIPHLDINPPPISLSDFYGASNVETAWRGVDPICEDDSISVSLAGNGGGTALTATVTGGTGNFSYLWYNPDGSTTTTTSSSRTVDSPGGEGTGIYGVTVTDANSLQAFDTEYYYGGT